MFWRMDRKEYKQLRGEGTKKAMEDLTCANKVPGFLAYDGERAVGWCSAAQRENFVALENSRILKRVDDQPVWSVTCFNVEKSARRRGVMSVLLRGVIDYAGQHGVNIVEGYPIDLQFPKLVGQNLTGYAGFMGIASAFREVGFTEVGRASETQIIMRYAIA